MITHVVDCYHIIAIYVNTVSISKQDIYFMIVFIHGICHNIQDCIQSCMSLKIFIRCQQLTLHSSGVIAT